MRNFVISVKRKLKIIISNFIKQFANSLIIKTNYSIKKRHNATFYKKTHLQTKEIPPIFP